MTLTEEEQLALSEFRTKIQEVFPDKKFTDKTLTKFLAARQFNLEKAEKMLVDAVAWRAERDIDKICSEFAYPEAEAVDNIYPRYCHKTDKIGRTVVINELGSVGPKLFEVTTEERFLTEHIREIEKISEYRTEACFKKNPESSNQIFTILDLKGASMTAFPQVRYVISSIAQIDTNYYPETLGCMVIINAPLIFTAVWAIIKRFLDPKTLSKIEIVGTNYTDTLLKFIDAENLPEYLGGTCSCPDGCRKSDLGPWNDGSVEGFPQEFWENYKVRDKKASLDN